MTPGYKIKKYSFILIAIIASLLALSPRVFAQALNLPAVNSIPAGGSISCQAHASRACYNVDVVATYAQVNGIPGFGATGTHKCWAIYNRSPLNVNVHIPMATLAEFQSFITAATGGDPYLTATALVTAAPCCDPTRCALPGHSLSCNTCTSEGSNGPGECCAWTCAQPNPLAPGTNVNGNPCCQIDDNPLITPRNPPFTLDPGLIRDPATACVDSCIGGLPEGNLANCDPWETKFSCCADCSAFSDGVCCANLPTPEDINNSCEDCGTNCGDGFCCPTSSSANPLAENRTNCADCAVCPDAYCSPGENLTNCCQDCNPVCGDGNCCAASGENMVNCCADCGCLAGNSCVAGACHDNCDTLPYINDGGSGQCTINAVTIHNQIIAGGCAVTGACQGQCADGNIINWVNNCCSNWADFACGPSGGCAGNQMYQTRSCAAIATVPLGQCVTNGGCCTGWVSQGCGGGPCSATQRRETRLCGSSTETQCITDGACCTNWANQGCAAGGCSQTEQYQTRTCGAAGQGQCVSDGGCCTGWSDVGCGGGCPGNQMRESRDCGGGTQYNCYNHGGCCTNWTNVGCNLGCGDQERREERWCGGSQSVNCVLDGGCCTGWGDQGCGNGCWQGQRREERSCGGSPEATCTTTDDCDWQGNWGPFTVIRHGDWASNSAGLANAPGGYQNYTIWWDTVGHRHGGSHFECSGSYGGIGISGVGDGGALGPEYGGYHGTQHSFPCNGSGTTGGNWGSVWVQVQDAEAFFYWTIRAF